MGFVDLAAGSRFLVRLGMGFALAFPATLLLAPEARAVEGTEPPLDFLYAKQNMLVAGKLLEIDPGGRLVFSFDELLSGQSQPPDRIEIRVPKEALELSTIGAEYIFAYTLYTSAPWNHEELRLDPNGGAMLVAQGLEPAMFKDSREIRLILNAGKDSEEEPSSRNGRESDERLLLRRLVGALTENDTAIQNLAANQIAMDHKLRKQLKTRDRKSLQKAVLNRKTLPTARSALLVSAWHHPDELGDWWQGAALKVLETTPVDGYASLAADPSTLVLASFEMLVSSGTKLAPEMLLRWVPCETPLVTEQALLALRRIEPKTERAAIQEALASPDLPAQTRKFIDDHLRRLNLLEARLREQKEGSH